MATSTDNIVVRMRLTGAREVVREAKSADRAIGGVGTTAGRTSKAAATHGGKMRSSFVGAAKSAAKFGAATIGIATAGAALRKVGTETIGFDAAMRNVNSIAQLSETQFGKLEQQVLDLAGPTAQAPGTLAEGLYDLVSSGFNAHQSLTILKSSAKAATAGLTDTSVSTKAVAAVLNAYRLKAKDAADVSDILFKTVDRGVINFEDLASNIGDVLPFASSLGVNLSDVGASIATMTKQGISPSETMTRIKNVMVTMLKPGTDLKNTLKDLGYESGEAMIKQEGFQGALDILAKTTHGSKEEMAKLFPNIRALGGALALTGDNAKSAGEDLDGMRHHAGATDKALSQQRKSISYQWNKLKAEASVLAIKVGFAFIKMVRDISEAKGKVGKVVNVLVRFLGPYIVNVVKGTVQFIGGAFKAIGDLFAVISDVIHGRWGKAWANFKELVKDVLGSVLGLLRVFTAPFAALGKLLGDGFISAVANAINWGIEKINDAMDKANVLGKLGVDAPNLPTIDVGSSPTGGGGIGGTGVQRHHHQGTGGGSTSGPGLTPLGRITGSSEPFVVMLDSRPIFEGLAKRARAEGARA